MEIHSHVQKLDIVAIAGMQAGGCIIAKAVQAPLMQHKACGTIMPRRRLHRGVRNAAVHPRSKIV